MEFFARTAFFVMALVSTFPTWLLPVRWRTAYLCLLSPLMLAALFISTPLQAVYLVVFICMALVAFVVLRQNPSQRWRYTLALILTIAPLVIYKVSATSGLPALLGSAGGMLPQNIMGFLGISYVSFKAIQVVIEMHGGLIKDMNIAEYLAFLTFYPTFSSGPIDRSRRFVEDLRHPQTGCAQATCYAQGICLILLGMVYKLIVGAWIQSIYDPHQTLSADALQAVYQQICIAYEYGGYLFFDFAGYSLMAQGLSYCLGIRTPQNFRAPFRAINIADFWERWHITLSQWLRDFVFMRFTRALIKRRLIKNRTRRAQLGFMVNMLLMGFWHGITLDYIAYGIYHGILMCAHESLSKTAFYKKHAHTRWYRALSWFVTLQLVLIGFALFSGQVSYVINQLIP